MEISPYLNFNGQCATAFKFYEGCLGGRIEVLMTHGESPMKDQVPADWQDKVLHARLIVNGRGENPDKAFALMGCDAPPTHYATPQGLAVTLSVPTTAEAERIYNALADHGKVTMPFQKTFWSSGFGMAVDRFGIPWMVSSEQQA
jgi:PhnB protein